MTPAVQDLAARVWERRDARDLKRDAPGLARALALVTAQDVRDYPAYDPETDVRVLWLREIVADMRKLSGWRLPRGGVDVEFALLLVLGKLEAEPCGKDLAAGG